VSAIYGLIRLDGRPVEPAELAAIARPIAPCAASNRPRGMDG
jgi:hypothetical protein